MGGRGSSSPSGGDKRNGYGKKEDPMNVPFDEWGQMINHEEIIDKNGDRIGYIQDEYAYNYEPDIHPVTKKDVLSEIDAWRNDDGTYGDEDTAIYLAYKDGTFVDTDDLNGKAYKKTGIVGASISTGDFEMVWGGEVGRDGEVHPWETWVSPSDMDAGERGHSNSYSGYKATSYYKKRTRVTFNTPNGRGGYKTVRETVRKSTTKPLER